jgi:hypothetical protein
MSGPPPGGDAARLKQALPASYAGQIVYAATAAEVDAACAQLLASGARVVGFDIECEWRA